MTIDITYSKSALSFLRKNADRLTREQSDEMIIKAIRKIYKISIESIDLKMLQGQLGRYRIRKGDIRIIFEKDDDGNIIVVSVHSIDYRGECL